MAVGFMLTSLLLAGALGSTYVYLLRVMEKKVEPLPPKPVQAATPPVSPLLMRYQLEVPGRGEIFPALVSAANYWPVAILTISNTAERAALQTVSAEVPGWTRRAEQTVVIGPRETRVVPLEPELLPAAFGNEEILRATLQVRVIDTAGAVSFAQTRGVLLHAASDLYWGKKFSNAQFVARWVTPHDPAILELVSRARKWAPRGRMPGYNQPRPSPEALEAQVRTQARAVFDSLRQSGISYVNSIFTFGNFAGDAQRIRLPRETLQLRSANCIDVSVAFAAAMENLGLHPVIVIVPGHAFAGVRLGPQSPAVLYLDLTVLPKGSFDRAVSRAQYWLRKSAPNEVLTVDVAAARTLGIYPMPVNAGRTIAALPEDHQGEIDAH
jgi:hypothetical protein